MRSTDYRLCLADTITGAVVADLALTGVPQWSREINGPGTLSQVPIALSPRLIDEMRQRMEETWHWTLLYCYGGAILQAGIMSGPHTVDDTQSPAIAQLYTMTLWDFLSKKRLVWYYGHQLTDATANVIFSATSPDLANQDLDLGGVARRLVEIAIGGTGCNGPGSSQGTSTGLGLPIVLPTPTTGTQTITYAASDLAYVGQRITELTQQTGAPEIEFRPEWTDSTQSYFQWRMRIGSPRLVQTGDPLVWDYQKACQSLPLTIDGTGMTFQSIAKGQDTRSSAGGTLAWGWSDSVTPTYPSTGWPWLITGDISHASEKNGAVLSSYANQDVTTHQVPVYTSQMVIRSDGYTKDGKRTGSPSVDMINVGDLGYVATNGNAHPWLPDGAYGLRVLAITAGPDQWTSTLVVQYLGPSS